MYVPLQIFVTMIQILSKSEKNQHKFFLWMSRFRALVLRGMQVKSLKPEIGVERWGGGGGGRGRLTTGKIWHIFFNACTK